MNARTEGASIWGGEQLRSCRVGFGLLFRERTRFGVPLSFSHEARSGWSAWHQCPSWISERNCIQLFRANLCPLAGCAQLTATSLDLLSRCPCAPRLRSLVLHQLVELTDVSLVALFTHTPLLTEVGLDELGPALTDGVLDSLAGRCRSLTSVSLARAGGGVTHPSLPALVARLSAHPSAELLPCAPCDGAAEQLWPDANWQQ
jgi:hypothetical protein